MTEARDIAVIAAALGAHRRFEARIVAIAFDQVGGIRERQSSVDEGRFHRRIFTPRRLSDCPPDWVNKPLAMFALAFPDTVCHGRAMPSSTHAGGCFLSLCILAGFPLGLAIGNPMKGILIGTGAGIALAVITWLIDRQHRG